MMASDKYPSPSSESEVPRRTSWLGLALPHLVPRSPFTPPGTRYLTAASERGGDGSEVNITEEKPSLAEVLSLTWQMQWQGSGAHKRAPAKDTSPF